MKAVLVLAAFVAGCTVTGAPPPRSCPPLPELPENPTGAQRAVHTAVLVRLYVQCAGGGQEE